MNPKYVTLIRILDKFRDEAPVEFKTYHPPEDDVEKVNQARAKAYIHLYLMVTCGLTDFAERQALICDGGYDGGLDAYHIDTENKRIRLIQSKFRPLEQNFEGKAIEADELVKME